MKVFVKGGVGIFKNVEIAIPNLLKIYTILFSRVVQYAVVIAALECRRNADGEM